MFAFSRVTHAGGHGKTILPVRQPVWVLSQLTAEEFVQKQISEKSRHLKSQSAKYLQIIHATHKLYSRLTYFAGTGKCFHTLPDAF